MSNQPHPKRGQPVKDGVDQTSTTINTLANAGGRILAILRAAFTFRCLSALVN
jgi:hypothetical protein